MLQAIQLKIHVRRLNWPDQFTKLAPLNSSPQALRSPNIARQWQTIISSPAMLLLAMPLLAMLLLTSQCLAEKPPNIIVILADDMGFSDLGSYGGEIHTPNIDQLAAQGVRFTAFYNTARCSTTRASLLTGRYPHNVQMGHLAGSKFKDIDGYRGQLDESISILPEWLKDHHYKSYMLGKWHLADWSPDKIPAGNIEQLDNTPLKRGFDHFYGTLFGGNNYFDPKFLYQNHEPIKKLEPNFYYTDAISHEAVRNISAHRANHSNRPFFLYLAYTAPHWPLQAPAETIDKYREVYSIGWDELRQKRLSRAKEQAIVPLDLALASLDEGTPPWTKVENKAWFIEKMAVHAAMVEHLDRGVGQVLDALRAQGELDNTVIMVMSDNGASAENFFEMPDWKRFLGSPFFDTFIGKYQPASGEAYSLGSGKDLMPGPINRFQMLGREWAQASNTPFKKYKTWVHEGGIASPLIVHWPRGLKERAGTMISEPAHVIDIMPTIISIVSGQPDLIQDGVNLLPAINGQALPARLLFFEHEGYRAVRSASWKLVAKQAGPWELYNIQVDRSERNNVAAHFPERVLNMETEYERYARDNKVKDWSKITSWP